MASSFFEEKSGIVPCNTKWGRWWQTVDEIHIEIKSPTSLKTKDIKINVTNSSITCEILGKLLFSVSFNSVFLLIYSFKPLWIRVVYLEKYMLMKLCGL